MFNKTATRQPHKPQRQSATTKPAWHLRVQRMKKRAALECLVGVKTGEPQKRQEILVTNTAG